jgi:folate-binding protein YgfZ
MTKGYQALRESAAWIDLSSRGRIRMTGEDRARLLHALTTNHVQQMKPGDVCYAFFLNAQGRILADVNIICREEDFLLDVEPEVRELVYQHLDHYIIADDVQLEDITESTACLGIEGPGSDQYRSTDSVQLTVTGAPAFRLYRDDEGLRQRLVQATPEDAELLRIENGKPRYGQDIFSTSLPQETQIAGALHFQKGCYLGQEIVERIRSRGHVNKLLVPFTAKQPLHSGDKIVIDGKEVGDVTSAVLSPTTGETVGLAYVRTTTVKAGETLSL